MVSAGLVQAAPAVLRRHDAPCAAEQATRATPAPLALARAAARRDCADVLGWVRGLRVAARQSGWQRRVGAGANGAAAGRPRLRANATVREVNRRAPRAEARDAILDPSRGRSASARRARRSSLGKRSRQTRSPHARKVTGRARSVVVGGSSPRRSAESPSSTTSNRPLPRAEDRRNRVRQTLVILEHQHAHPIICVRRAASGPPSACTGTGYSGGNSGSCSRGGNPPSVPLPWHCPRYAPLSCSAAGAFRDSPAGGGARPQWSKQVLPFNQAGRDAIRVRVVHAAPTGV